MHFQRFSKKKELYDIYFIGLKRIRVNSFFMKRTKTKMLLNITVLNIY